MRRAAVLVTLLLAALGVTLLYAANVITDGNMELAGITNWTHVNVTGTNSSAKATDWKVSGAQSLKGTSAAGKAINVEWYNWQQVGTINSGDTVTLSLQYAFIYSSIQGGVLGTLYADISPNGTTWTNVWTQAITPNTVRQTGQVSALDVSALVPSSSTTYRLRIRFAGKTGNVNGATINVWWDDVVLDVSAPAPITTTIGDGTDASATPCPTDGATFADSFTLQSSRNSTVTAVNVSLGTGAAAGLSLVEITNDGGTALGSVSNPASDTTNVPLSTNITSTTTPTQYKVRVTPKGHSAPSAVYTVAARVASISSNASTVTNNDAGDSTVVIDNAPPSNATWGSNSASDGSVTLNWTNPGADFSEVVILRSPTTPITAVPVEGQSYAPDATIGSATVRYVGNGTTASDTAVTNGTTYYYKAFARDACGNYAAGVESAGLRPDVVASTTTVGDGTDPSPSSTCPGGAAKIAGAFTLQTSGNSNAVTSVTVTLTGGYVALSKIEIIDDASSVYGAINGPVSDVVVVPVTITATPALTQYSIRITPKDDASIPGGSYAIGARVTEITATNLKDYQDADGSTVTIDNAAPANASWGSSSVGDATITLQWSRPGDAADVLIVRAQSSPVTASPADGVTYAEGNPLGSAVVRYAGALSTFTDDPVANGTSYYYKIFARDACGNYAAGNETGPLVPTGVVPALAAGTGSASVDSCSQITVRAPFGGDQPSNSSTRFEYATAVSGPWTTACVSVTGASPRTCVLSPLTEATTYYIRVTHTDADGVTGQNPQIVGPWTTPVTCAQAATTAGTASLQAGSCKQVAVSAPFTGDGDRDGAVKVEYNTSNTWPGTTACATASGESPRQCLVTTLNASTQYWFRVSYTDPDGVSGSATQVLGPLTTSACGADAVAPMVLFLAPARGALVGGTDRAKVQVFDAGGLAVSNPVRWSIDGGALSSVISVNSNYSCGTGCTVYEFDLATAPLANGPHFVTVQVTDAAGNVGRVAQPFNVGNTAAGASRGGGRLLRRTHSSQLCADCHALESHSSQSTNSAKYGSWAVDCLTCHTPHRTPNVKLIRPEIVTPSSGTMSVDLRTVDHSGGTNPQSSLLGAYDGTGAPFNDGVCEVCHTRTTHYRNDASGGDHTHYQNQRCTGCHTHVTGFKGSGCNGCHYAPPSVGKHRTKHDEVWDSTDGNAATSYDDATSHATATQYGFACASCHAGSHLSDGAPHDGSSANPWQVEVLFQGKNATAGASYSGTYNQSSEAGPGGKYFSYSNGTCASSYCHSNAAPVGGQNLSVGVTWSGTATTCASCHKTGGFGDGANDNTFLSKSHAAHIQSTSGETSTYSYKCSACHAAVIVANPNDPWGLATADLKDKRLHVDENKQEVTFGTVGSADQSSGSYNGTGRTCGSTYCHSQGTSTTSFLAPNTAIAWGQTASCITCHNGNAAQPSNKMATGKHGQHIDITATYGQNIGCATCHATTLSADMTLNASTGYAAHVNGTRDVSGTSVGTWGNPTCASSRCHSSGVRVGTVEYYTVNWATGAAITDCKGCHGRHSDNAFVSVAGEPNYTNVPASNKFNSHKAHVTSANNCRTCHNSTISTANKIDGSTPAKHMDFDDLPDITFVAPYSSGTYNKDSRTCTVGCHGTGTPTWGGATILCLGCHSGTEGDALGNGIPNGVSTQWASKGHGSAAGGTFTSTLNGCDYCHDLASDHTPTNSSNPYRLRFSATDNTLCLKCHASTTDTGIGVNSAGTNLTLENSTKNVGTAHFGNKHQSGEGGGLCWDCHDPHGTPTNILMVKDNVTLVSNAYGVPTVTKVVTFTARATAADFIRTSGVTRTGICQACHDPGKGTDITVGSTKYWRWDGTDDDGLASDHQSGRVCTSCHKHTNNFKGEGGDCLGCHGDGSGAPARRAVTADFADGTTPNFRSHHVGSGTANALKGTLNNFDCVVCHAEGKLTPDKLDTDTAGQPHGDGFIDLRNVDSATAYYTYDKDAVEASAGTNLAQWGSANAVWRTQTSTALDPFCLTCHDSNGASQIAALGETGASAGNPFKDTTVTNNYDQLNRGAVTDIKSKVSGAPPAQGTFSRHAIRGQSTSIYTNYQNIGTGYTSVYEFGGFVNAGTSENGPLWNDTSVMGCADCHTTDGANGTSGNAHGSSSEYLLKDASGGATEGTLAGQNYNCYRCHALGKYDTGMTHAPNANDYQDTTAYTGAARTTTGKGGTIYGIACMNCHGGAGSPTTGSPVSAGWIHGTNQTFGVGQNGGAGTRNAYRFMNGGSMRYYQPSNSTWSAGPGGCYTLSSGDTWGGCTQHNRSSGTGLTAPTRPLTY